MPQSNSYRYQLFISYTRTPDEQVAREVERFLEAFHQNIFPESKIEELPILEICLDGSDFSLPPLEEGNLQDGKSRDVIPVLHRYLKQSKEILLFCSQRAATSVWVAEEIRWFLENRGPGAIRLALTEGDKPWEEPEKYFAKAIRDHNLPSNIAYDFRGYDERRSANWYQIPDFKKELFRLAADLHGISASDLYPTWLESQLAKARKDSVNRASTARFEVLAGDPVDAILKAYEAHQLHPSELTEKVLRDAYRVAVLHHFNRREMAQFSGAGPGYLAGRWKQGEVFVKSSPDGRYQVLVTERGKDGATPPGDIYLVSNESQRVIPLLPQGDSQRRRVEEVAFSQDSKYIFVTRYFHLNVFNLAGEVMGTYAFSRHTKSPVHLLAGYFNERYIIGCETKGGIWLVDPNGDRNSTIQIQSEWSGKDAVVQVSINQNGQRALLVFESGRAILLSLSNDLKAEIIELSQTQVLFATFQNHIEELMLTSNREGFIQWWREKDGQVEKVLSSEPLLTAIDWVSTSKEHPYLAAVGANQSIFFLEKAQGTLLHTLDFKEDIDWGELRKVVVRDRIISRLPLAEVVEEKEGRSFDFEIVKQIQLGAENWVITKEVKEDGTFQLPVFKAWRSEGDTMKCYASYVNDIILQQDIYLMQISVGINGLEYYAFCKDGSQLRRFPKDNVRVKAITAWKDGLLMGTDKGVYYHSPTENLRLTSTEVKVEKIEIIDEQIWLATKQGAYLVEDDRVVRITPPFIWVRAIKKVAGRVWLLTTQEGGGFANRFGPCYLVDGYHIQLLPDQNTQVWDVIEVDGFAWIAADKKLFQWLGKTINPLSYELETYANQIVKRGKTLWVTTHTRGFMPGSGPFYRIKDGIVEKRKEHVLGFLEKGTDAYVEYFKDGEKVKAKLSDDLEEVT